MNEERSLSRRQALRLIKGRADVRFKVRCQVCGWTGPNSIEDGLINWIGSHACQESQYSVRVTGTASPFRSRLPRLLRRLERFAQDFWALDDRKWEAILKEEFQFVRAREGQLERLPVRPGQETQARRSGQDPGPDVPPDSAVWKIAEYLRTVAKLTHGGGERDLPADKTCFICRAVVRVQRKPRRHTPRKPLLPRSPTCGKASCRVAIWRKLNPRQYNQNQAALMSRRREKEKRALRD